MNFKREDPGFPTKIQDVQDYLNYLDRQHKKQKDVREELVDVTYFVNQLNKNTHEFKSLIKSRYFKKLFVVTENVSPVEVYISPKTYVYWNIRSPQTFLDLLQRQLQNNIAPTKYIDYRLGPKVGEKDPLLQSDFRILFLAQALNNHLLALCEPTTAYGRNNDNTPIIWANSSTDEISRRFFAREAGLRQKLNERVQTSLHQVKKKLGSDIQDIKHMFPNVLNDTWLDTCTYISNTYNLRKNFEGALIPYTQARYSAEEALKQLATYMELVDEGEKLAPTSIKDKLNAVIEKATKGVIATAHAYNMMAMWATWFVKPEETWKPNWYTLAHKGNIPQNSARWPWHQQCTIGEAHEIEALAAKLEKIINKLREKNIYQGVLKEGELTSTLAVEKPDHRQATSVYFEKLKNTASLESPGVFVKRENSDGYESSTPSDIDLETLTTAWIMEKSKDVKLDESDARMGIFRNEIDAQFHTASDTVSSDNTEPGEQERGRKTRKLVRRSRKDSRNSSSSTGEESDIHSFGLPDYYSKKRQERIRAKSKEERGRRLSPNNSDDSISSINSNCSPAVVLVKTKKKHSVLKAKLQCLTPDLKNEEKLKSLKADIGRVMRKLEQYGGDSARTENLLEDMSVLEELANAKLDQLKEKQRKINQLPKGKLAVWDTNITTPGIYTQWRRDMKSNLIYDSETLKLTTLKNQITGSKKSFILKLLCYCETLDEALEELDSYFGDIRTVLPQMKRNLDKLHNEPTTREDENYNITELMMFYRAAKEENLHDIYIDRYFVESYSMKLSQKSKMALIEGEFYSCEMFVAFLKKVSRNNNIYLHTQQPKTGKSSFYNENFTVPPTRPGDQGRGGNTGGRGGGSHRGGGHQSYRNGCFNCGDTQHRINDCPKPPQGSRRGRPPYGGSSQVTRRPKCCICADAHMPYRCPLVTLNKDVDGIKKTLVERKICVKCLFNHPLENECKETSKPFICTVHKVNKTVCKCSAIPSLARNSTVTLNNTFIGSAGFLSENVIIEYGGAMVEAVLTYDSWCTHSTIDKSLQSYLDSPVDDCGTMEVKTFFVSKKINGFKTRLKLNNLQLDFIVDKVQQNLPEFEYKIPPGWQEMYSIKPRHKSVSGLCNVVLGMDNFALFPNKVAADRDSGIVISQSQLTGNYLLAGRASATNEEEIYHNRMVFNNIATDEPRLRLQNCKEEDSKVIQDFGQTWEGLSPSNASSLRYGHSQPNSTKCKELGDKTHPNSTTILDNQTITELERTIKDSYSTESILVSPEKRCSGCKNCKMCKKTHLPDIARQLDQIELIKKNISFDEPNSKYTASYVYNANLPALPDYKEPVLNMMKNLEKKLEKSGLTAQFNEVVNDFFKRGVIGWLGTIPGIENEQESYIPLTFTLDPDKTTKLRVCTNSSFFTGKNVSLNNCMISGPSYLIPMQDILLRWRVAQQCAIADIRHCYHSVESSPLDRSLRRIHLKREGMGSQSVWDQACFKVVSFGDVLGGSFAQLSVLDCAERFIKHPSVLENLSQNTYMDDISLLDFGDPKTPQLSDMKKSTEMALNKGGFKLKQWTMSGDKKAQDIKYLSYIYHPASDTFSCKVKVNFSKLRRGVREEKDIKDENELREYIERKGLTRRNVASLMMSITHDPLQIFAPLHGNLKLAYRKITRRNPNDWDKQIDQDLKEIIIKSVSKFYQIKHLQIQRKTVDIHATKIIFRFYWDSSEDMLGVTVIAINIYPNKTRISRLLLNKNRILSTESTVPRKELQSALISSRLYRIVKDQLSMFFSSFMGEITFEMVGDSLIVLNQIRKPSYNFNSFVSCRISEIQQTIEFPVKWFHVKTKDNISDVLTRSFDGHPKDLPWIKYEDNLPVDDESLTEINVVPTQSLPDINKTEVMMNSNIISKSTDLSDFKKLLFYHKMTQHQENDEDSEPKKMIMEMMTRISSYFKVVNVIAFILKWKNKNETFKECQDKATKIIFSVFQKENERYMKSFKGNMFYTTSRDFNEGKIYYLKGRETQLIPGGITLLLIPPNTALSRIIAKSYHSRHHKYGTSPSYVRTQIMQHFYLPSALKTLKSIQDHCPLCRRRTKRAMHALMGQIGMDRLTYSRPWVSAQMDLTGPIKIRDFANQRSSRKIWLLTAIDDFSRYITVTPVEDLSKQALLNSMNQHFWRYGVTTKITADFGSNFSSVAKELEKQDILTPEDLTSLSQELKSAHGCEIIQKSPHSPHIQGGIERANALIKMIIPHSTLTLFQLLTYLECCMFTINRRPIGAKDSSNTEVVRPSDIIPVYSGLQQRLTLNNCSGIIETARKEFYLRWRQLHSLALLRQKKWIEDNTEGMKINSLVLILDLLGSDSFPKMGRIVKIEDNRYFFVEYKVNKRFKQVKRVAQSLCLLLEDQIHDPILFMKFTDLNKSVTKRLKVKAQNNPDEIVDI